MAKNGGVWFGQAKIVPQPQSLALKGVVWRSNKISSLRNTLRANLLIYLAL